MKIFFRVKIQISIISHSFFFEFSENFYFTLNHQTSSQLHRFQSFLTCHFFAQLPRPMTSDKRKDVNKNWFVEEEGKKEPREMCV